MIRLGRFASAVAIVAVAVSTVTPTRAVTAQDAAVLVDPATVAPLKTDVTCPASGRSHRNVAHAVRYRGRVYFLADEHCKSAFVANPGAIAQRVEPRGLFHPTDASKSRSNAVWIGGLLVVLGLVCGAFASYVAVGRGHDGLRWFATGAVLSVVGVALAFALRPRAVPFAADGLRKMPSTRAPATCATCSATLHPAASKCTACGAARAAAIESEIAHARTNRRDRDGDADS